MKDQIQKYKDTRTRLQDELQQLAEKEAGILKQAGADLLEGKEGKAEQELVRLRTRREVLQSGLEQLSEQIRLAEQELQDKQLGEAAGAWIDFEKTFWAELEKMRAAIGEAGLNGQVEDLNNRMQGALSAYHFYIRGEPESYLRIQQALKAFSRNLYEVWKALENVRAHGPGHLDRPISSQGSTFSGFGKLP